MLYLRATEGSRKDAAAMMGVTPNTARHYMTGAFAKLGVEDLAGAFRAMGWLKPVPYGVSAAEVRHERLDEGETLEQIEHDFWRRITHREPKD